MTKLVRNLILPLAAAYLLFSPISALAIELSIPNLSGSPFDKIEVPVAVTGFDNVAGVELHITYDDGNLTIDSVTSAFLSGATINAGIAGQVHVVWDSNNAVSIPDGGSVIVMFFRVKPDAGGTSDFIFYGHIELTNQAGIPYSVSWTDGTVTIIPTDVDDHGTPLPGEFALLQNHPNPFNPTTTIAFTLQKSTDITITIFNISGQVVDRIDLGREAAGLHSFEYSGAKLASGIYTYRLTGDGVSQARQMVLVK
jgi:hypothetical protein